MKQKPSPQMQRRQRGLCIRCGQPAFIHPHGRWQGQPSNLCPEHMGQRRAARRVASGYAQRHPTVSDLTAPAPPSPASLGRTRAEHDRLQRQQLLQEGRCVWCGQPAFVYPSGPRQGQVAHHCRKHMDRNQERWQNRRRDGRCVWCGQPAVRYESGPQAGECFAFCLEHLIHAREQLRQRSGAIKRLDAPSYRAQRAAGLATPDLPPDSGGRASQKLLAQQWRAQGLCLKCGQPALLHLTGRRKGQPAGFCLRHARLTLEQCQARSPRRRHRLSLVELHHLAASGTLPPSQSSQQAERRRQGLCVKCGQPALLYLHGQHQGKHSPWCLHHLVEAREAERRRTGATKRRPSASYEAEIAAGLTSPDRLPPARPFKSKTERLREQRQQGLCVRCSKPAVLHLWGQRKGQPARFCAEHLAQRREYVRQLYGCTGRAKSLSYAIEGSLPLDYLWRQGRTNEEIHRAGLCLKCGQPAPVHQTGRYRGQPRVHCDEHRKEKALYERQSRALRPVAASGAAGPAEPLTPPAGQPPAPTQARPPAPAPSPHHPPGRCRLCQRPAEIRLSGPKQGQPKIYCSEHRAKKSEYARQRKERLRPATEPTPRPDLSWQQGRTYHELTRAGLCVLCGQPAEVHLDGKKAGQPYIHCPRHRKQMTEYQRQRQKGQKPSH